MTIECLLQGPHLRGTATCPPTQRHHCRGQCVQLWPQREDSRWFLLPADVQSSSLLCAPTRPSRWTLSTSQGISWKIRSRRCSSAARVCVLWLPASSKCIPVCCASKLQTCTLPKRASWSSGMPFYPLRSCGTWKSLRQEAARESRTRKQLW